MINFEKNSLLLKDFLVSAYGKSVPGCVFYITRNGIPFADGSFGWARLPGSPEGQSPVTVNTMMHTASVGKVFTLFTLLIMIQEWNAIHSKLNVNPAWTPFNPNDVPFRNFVKNFGKEIDLDAKMFPLVRPFLDDSLIAGYLSSGLVYPGLNVQDITLRDLVNHSSGLLFNFNLADTGVTDIKAVKYEPSDGGMAVFDSKKIMTAILKNDANTQSTGYQNVNYILIGAIIESVTGRSYNEYAVTRLFRGDANYSDLRRRVTDLSKNTRYYINRFNNNFIGGVLHPDYSNFSADGGWYMSAKQFCKWFDKAMNGELIGRGRFNFGGYNFKDPAFGAFGHGVTGRLGYFSKNGGTSVGGGSANADFRYYYGYDNERYCVFTAVNSDINASKLIDDGVNVLKTVITKRPHGFRLDSSGVRGGLLQYVYADGTVTNPAIPLQVKNVNIENVTIDGISLQRTNLLGMGSTLPLGLSSNSKCSVELRGMLKIPVKGYYKFRLSSDDGSELWINDELVIDYNFEHSLSSIESTELYFQGNNCYFPFRIEWFNNQGGGLLYLEWKIPGNNSFEAIPANNFGLVL